MREIFEVRGDFSLHLKPQHVDLLLLLILAGGEGLAEQPTLPHEEGHGQQEWVRRWGGW